MNRGIARLQFVGFSCREIASSGDQPDKELAKGINRFGARCRECRVPAT